MSMSPCLFFLSVLMSFLCRISTESSICYAALGSTRELREEGLHGNYMDVAAHTATGPRTEQVPLASGTTETHAHVAEFLAQRPLVTACKHAGENERNKMRDGEKKLKYSTINFPLFLYAPSIPICPPTVARMGTTGSLLHKTPRPWNPLTQLFSLSQGSPLKIASTPHSGKQANRSLYPRHIINGTFVMAWYLYAQLYAGGRPIPYSTAANCCWILQAINSF